MGHLYLKNCALVFLCPYSDATTQVLRWWQKPDGWPENQKWDSTGVPFIRQQTGQAPSPFISQVRTALILTRSCLLSGQRGNNRPSCGGKCVPGPFRQTIEPLPPIHQNKKSNKKTNNRPGYTMTAYASEWWKLQRAWLLLLCGARQYRHDEIGKPPLAWKWDMTAMQRLMLPSMYWT